MRLKGVVLRGSKRHYRVYLEHRAQLGITDLHESDVHGRHPCARRSEALRKVRVRLDLPPAQSSEVNRHPFSLFTGEAERERRLVLARAAASMLPEALSKIAGLAHIERHHLLAQEVAAVLSSSRRSGSAAAMASNRRRPPSASGIVSGIGRSSSAGIGVGGCTGAIPGSPCRRMEAMHELTSPLVTPQRPLSQGPGSARTPRPSFCGRPDPRSAP
jgi:hypothetical protein